VITQIFIPKLDANTVEATLIKWYKSELDEVAKGEPLLAIETDKAVIDIESESSGVVLKILARESERILIPAVVGLLGESIEELNSAEFRREIEGFAARKEEVRQEAVPEIRDVKAAVDRIHTASPAAKRIAREKGIDLAWIKATGSRGEITVKDVMAFLGEAPQVSRSVKGSGNVLRVLVLGAGDGGKIISEILSFDPAKQVVGFLDDNSGLWGQDIKGRKVLGAIDQVFKLRERNIFDALIISITSNWEFRGELFQRCRTLGVEFINVVHPAAYISPSAEIGCGNLIYGPAFIGTETKIGDNNLISSHCSIEHHNTVGNHNLFGPGVLTSGAVVVGNDCIFGAGVCIEPHLRIGDNARIASGLAISSHVPNGVVLKTKFSVKG
jgi:sugar O-acyltransferase (sialic acid O-acetyltransferase NeuD family)